MRGEGYLSSKGDFTSQHPPKTVMKATSCERYLNPCGLVEDDPRLHDAEGDCYEGVQKCL